MKQVLKILILILIAYGCEEEYVVTDIRLSSNKSEIIAGRDSVTFWVTDARGNDITSEVQLFNNLEPFVKLSFSSDTVGEFEFYATYGELVSNTAKIVVVPYIKHQKNVLIEDYTGSWCGYCPRVANAINEALKLSNNINVIAIHDDAQMKYSKVEELKTEFEIEGLPTAIIDRYYKWPFPEDFSGLNDALSKPALCGIEIETNYMNNYARLKVNVEFAGGFITDVKLGVYITQSNLIFNQANYYPELGSNPIVNFKHDNVMRLALTDLMGDDIEVKLDSVYSKDYIFKFENVKPEDVNIVAFVVDKTSKEVLNSRSTVLGNDADFQLLD